MCKNLFTCKEYLEIPSSFQGPLRHTWLDSPWGMSTLSGECTWTAGSQRAWVPGSAAQGTGWRDSPPCQCWRTVLWADLVASWVLCPNGWSEFQPKWTRVCSECRHWRHCALTSPHLQPGVDVRAVIFVIALYAWWMCYFSIHPAVLYDCYYHMFH